MTVGANTVKGQLSVVGGRGKENVRINATTAERLYASLGAGDDWLNIKGTTVRSTWYLDGGSGSDSLNLFGNNKTLTSTGFESKTAYSWL